MRKNIRIRKYQDKKILEKKNNKKRNNNGIF